MASPSPISAPGLVSPKGPKPVDEPEKLEGNRDGGGEGKGGGGEDEEGDQKRGKARKQLNEGYILFSGASLAGHFLIALSGYTEEIEPFV